MKVLIKEPAKDYLSNQRDDQKLGQKGSGQTILFGVK